MNTRIAYKITVEEPADRGFTLKTRALMGLQY